VGLPGGTTDLGECKQDTPHLTFISQAIFSNGLQLGVPEMGSVEEQTT
jgi:hypothetical protein